MVERVKVAGQPGGQARRLPPGQRAHGVGKAEAGYYASDVDLPKSPVVDREEPRTGASGSNRPFDRLPVTGQAYQPLPGREVPLSGDPEDTQASVSEGLNLRGLGPDAAIPRYDDETTRRHGRYPVGVECSERTLRDQLVPGVDQCRSAQPPRPCQAQARSRRRRTEGDGGRPSRCVREAQTAPIRQPNAAARSERPRRRPLSTAHIGQRSCQVSHRP